MLLRHRCLSSRPDVPRSAAAAAPPSSNNTASIIELHSPAEFESLVMAASNQPPPVGGPVVLDFYADWCQPCKQLTPKLEKLVTAAQGSVRLAKVNVDKLPELAQALQVASLPTVMLVHKGKLVDSFQGVQPDANLRTFIEKAIKLAGGAGGGARALEHAAALLEDGDVAEATKAYSELLALPEHAAAGTAGLALCALADENVALASELIAELHKKHPADLNKPEVRRAISKVALATEAGGDGTPIAELRRRVAADPVLHQHRFELAQALIKCEQYEEAINELLHIIKKERSWSEGAAKMRLLQIFDSLGVGHQLTKSGRRRLANILLI